MGQEQDRDNPKSGPEPERLQIDGDWEDAVGKMLKAGKAEGDDDRDEPKKQDPKDESLGS